MNTKAVTEDQDDVIDDAVSDKSVAIEKYAISSFGIDFDVEGLIRRMKKGEIYVPDFQRNFVWSHRESSQFVESLLLGLPVPGVFLAKDRQTQKLMIIDGQQRLKSLQFFYDGYFRPDLSKKHQQVFELTEVQPQFAGRTYETLDEEDQRRLDNSVIHATIIKQDSPDEEEDSSLYYVFGRLNSGGRKVTAQEIRTAIYNGELSELIERLNSSTTWRSLFGKESIRLKDRELILRFLALYDDAGRYERPMEEFLNRYARKYRHGPAKHLKKVEAVFQKTISTAYSALGASAFRPVRSMNAAVFDSIAVALAWRLDRGPITNEAALKRAFEKLAQSDDYIKATSSSTADEGSVETRLRLATEAFASVK
ncbi:MAG: DUF262 domain-containing protein [Polaromonas sp.]|uniref:DUF262 domain-containing protein n=1 Tax=Polaromonas sp. TaxID=1869339 RepID=UPI002722A1A5|nr:DUF262 domain-containing protein [Polaromonas sp.]MDO9113264.1 DUF262 domain-containing protein [Polaromonas sp.]MDP1889105.1 DUF262 domain-containing protein [Polaromonas sp.]